MKFFICPTNAHNSYKIVKLLKSFEIIIVAPTCFGLHKPSSGSFQLVLRQSYNVDIGYIYRYWSYAYAATASITSTTIYVTDINIVTLIKHRLKAPWWWFK